MKENKIYGRANGKIYNRTYGHRMDKHTKQILWTALWMIFIGGLCVLFNSAAPLWLLVFWLIGVA